MLDIKNIFPIGMGTWGIGGFAERNPQNDDKKQISAMIHMLHRGVNLIEATYWYAEGRAVSLIEKSIKESGNERKNLFLSSTIYPYRNPHLRRQKKSLMWFLKS